MTKTSCRFPLHQALFLLVAMVVGGGPRVGAAQTLPSGMSALERAYATEVRPLLDRYCFECHAENEPEAEIDLSAFATLADARRQLRVWERVDEMLDSLQMPPRKADQPAENERRQLREWVREFLIHEAGARAGDPGRVVLRRLSNAEYTHTVRDLTGVDTLDPAREFPVDGAAGEGFTNTGEALSMSPALITKFLDAAKEIARHLVLLPDGVTFSPHTTRRDWADQWLADIRAFYRQYTTQGGGTKVDLQGVKFETNDGGLLPLEDYLAATLAERDQLRSGAATVGEIARRRGLSPKYLGLLWGMLGAKESPASSFLLDSLRARWRAAEPEDVPALTAEIDRWRQALWKFNSVGHIGREGSPASWMQPVNPIVTERHWELPLPSSGGEDGEVTVYLAAGDGGDGNEGDFVVWQRPRLEGNGLPPVLLRDVGGLPERLAAYRRDRLARTARYLEAAAAADEDTDAAALAARYGLPEDMLAAWLDYLEISDAGAATVEGHFTEKLTRGGNYDFIAGWGSDDTPSVLANSSDQEVRIPGIAKPHGIVVHPSPTHYAAVGWRSPIAGLVRVEARLADAHPECGNGVEWLVQHRTARRTGVLTRGEFVTAGSAVAPAQTVSVRPGELVSLLVGPRQGNHACDLTSVEFIITETTGERRVWDLAAEVSGDIVRANPRDDRHGHDGVWHFYRGDMEALDRLTEAVKSVPAGSLLARWQAATDADERRRWASRVEQLALGEPPADAGSPDAILFAQLRNLATPRDYDGLVQGAEKDGRFGRHPLGHDAAPEDLVVRAPSVQAFRIPAQLAEGRTLVVTARMETTHGADGSTQPAVSTSPPDLTAPDPAQPILTGAGDAARRRVAGAFDAFRELIPAALCYMTIVPVDEVVTMTLYHREDEPLRRLMLDDAESGRLERLWDEMLFISQEPLQKVVSYEQISEFATQDRPDLVKAFAPLRPSLEAAADAFRQRQLRAEPTHLQALIDWADRAWRRPLTESEDRNLRRLYRELRDEGLAHDESCRLLLARILTSPAFLYRLEQPGPGEAAVPVSNLELASRLSYFLWASLPDAELRRVAEAGDLTDETVLIAQARRMLGDAKTRRLAVEFACQWLHIRDFDRNDDKNEALYPEFAELRGPMYEEAVRFFEDMFRNDGSILGVLNADHTFLNEALAGHYGIGGVSGESWRRVKGVRARGRGGVLAMAAVLASQSGASRTSPILRGNWIYETLLGEHLPKPPPNVPQLPDTVPEGLTARQLIEHHSSTPECARCHERIDPYGFALEQYDAIGRLRAVAADTRTTVLTGETIEGWDGLRDYLARERRGDVLLQFCRKLLGYALAREIQLSDYPLLADMRATLEANDHRFGAAVEAVVTSPQFRNIRGGEFSEE